MSTTVHDLREVSAEVTLQLLRTSWSCSFLGRKLLHKFEKKDPRLFLIFRQFEWFVVGWPRLDRNSFFWHGRHFFKKVFFLLKEPRERGGQQHSVTSQSHLTALVCNIKILSLAFTTATNAQASSYYALVHYYARPQVYITMNMFADDKS